MAHGYSFSLVQQRYWLSVQGSLPVPLKNKLPRAAPAATQQTKKLCSLTTVLTAGHGNPQNNEKAPVASRDLGASLCIL